jgi:DNA-binding MarR family transcriptional regulator
MSETHEQIIKTVLESHAAILRKLRRSVAPGWLQLDLSIAQVRVLFVLTQHPDAPIGTIAQALGIGLPTASHLVEKLVRAGLVQRTEDPKDRRQTLVRLTQQGEDLIEHLSQDRLEQVRFWLNQLNEEELTALRVGLEALARVAETTQPQTEQCPPSNAPKEQGSSLHSNERK